MKKNKRGAIELSMSTIIIIIIGITLLSLGLMWIKNIFSEITDLSDKAFGLTDQQIEVLFEDSNSLLNIMPNSIELKQGKGVIVGVVLSNLEGEEIIVDAKASPGKEGLECIFEDTQSETSEEYKLKSGASKKIKLIIKSNKDTPLGYNSCKVEINLDIETSYSTSETTTVNVIKK